MMSPAVDFPEADAWADALDVRDQFAKSAPRAKGTPEPAGINAEYKEFACVELDFEMLVNK
ncbi:MAG: hypothetical protein ACAH80_06060 [Alphaproteobacteria bacterium]